MAVLVLTDAKIFHGAFDLSGDHNRIAESVEVEEVDVTTFGNTGRRRRAGLSDVRLTGNGIVNAGVGLQDAVMFADQGVEAITTLAPNGTEGGRAASFNGIQFKYVPMEAEVGDAHSFMFEASGTGLYVPGNILHGLQARTTTGNGTQLALPSPASGEEAYAAVHVTAVSGSTPTLDLTVQSDTSGFPSPTTRYTFPQFTTIGSAFSTAIAGPITDTHWRVGFTIGGGSPSFTFIVTYGIR